MPVQAALLGLLAGSAPPLGAAVAWIAAVPARLVAAVMAFGSVVLVSALSSEPMDEAHRQGGCDPTALGFLGGAAVHTAANIATPRRGGGRRKRSGDAAAGAVPAILADTMVPEAFEEARGLTGPITVTGFLAALGLSGLGG